MRKNIAIFASGSGSNAEVIISFFKEHPLARVALVLSNKENAFVLNRAAQLNVPATIFNRATFYESHTVDEILEDYNIDFIVLAGFMWLFPERIISRYPNRILNIHPALLPKYGGKGMYGDRVHKAVLQAGEKYSGISIHFVNAEYDKGEMVFQEKCRLEENETPESLAEKVHRLEHFYYPRIIEKCITELE
ncbi:MAG: phosphoribosylglycinamide formyltransferase [Cyclobacteriaceae bacterium]|nr:phosphoribosylglycinamide formyltransferase [Cyclobacteriaceae bacterium]